MVQLYIAALLANGFLPGLGSWNHLTENEQQVVSTLDHELESYHYIGNQRSVERLRAQERKVFLDSGAFSAWTLGATLSVADYCEYILANSDIIRVEDGVLMASVLDGIGDPLQTYRNQLEMEARGVRPLPCFHFGEDERYLDYYIANYEYITIGGMVGHLAPQLRIWLDRVWPRMLDGSGNPRLKVHAFGVTQVNLMQEYPWYSVDSSSWVQAAAFGNLILPNHGLWAISDRSTKRHDAGGHLATLSPVEEAYVRSLMVERGFDFHRLMTDTYSRRVWNIMAFQEIAATINAEKGLHYRTHVRELF